MRRRAVVAALVALAALLVFAPAANAAPIRASCSWMDINILTGKCSDGSLTGSECEAPTPANPEYMWSSRPENPPDADPFAPNPTTSIFEGYGLGGFRWVTCDLAITQQSPRWSNVGANFLLNYAKSGASLADVSSGPAYDRDWLHHLDPLVTNTIHAGFKVFWTPWNPGGSSVASIAFIAAAIMMFSAIRRADVPAVAATLAVGIATVAVVAAVAASPTKVAAIADPIGPAILGGINQGINEVSGEPRDPRTAAIGNLVDTTLWQDWLRGEFGDPNSPTAQKYGPCLFKASAFSWVEKDAYDRDPGGAGKKIVEAKAAEWKRCTGEIKKDPVAYSYIKGDAPDDTRSQAGMDAFLMGAASDPMYIIANVFMALSHLIRRFVIIAVPVIALAWIFPKSHGLAVATARTFAASVWNSIVFGTAIAFATVAYRTVLDPASGMSQFLRLLLMAFIGLAMFFALKPFMKPSAFVHFTKPANPVREVRDTTRKVASGAAKIAMTAAGTWAGASVAMPNLSLMPSVIPTAPPGPAPMPADTADPLDPATYTKPWIPPDYRDPATEGRAHSHGMPSDAGRRADAFGLPTSVPVYERGYHRVVTPDGEVLWRPGSAPDTGYDWHPEPGEAAEDTAPPWERPAYTPPEPSYAGGGSEPTDDDLWWLR